MTSVYLFARASDFSWIVPRQKVRKRYIKVKLVTGTETNGTGTKAKNVNGTYASETGTWNLPCFSIREQSRNLDQGQKVELSETLIRSLVPGRQTLAAFRGGTLCIYS